MMHFYYPADFGDFLVEESKQTPVPKEFKNLFGQNLDRLERAYRRVLPRK